MRHLLMLLCLGALACGHSGDSPTSARPNAQQAEPARQQEEPAPQEQPAEGAAPSTPPAEPSMQAQEPSTPRVPSVDGSTPPPQPSAASAASTSCKADADCQAFDDMCGACRCLPLSKGAAPPACQEAKVQCVMAPCRGKRAVCKSGTCGLLDASSDSM